MFVLLSAENELGISFQMSFVSLDWKHRKIISMLAPTLFSGEKFGKYIQLEYDETQIIDE